jgi:hypothetical protein
MLMEGVRACGIVNCDFVLRLFFAESLQSYMVYMCKYLIYKHIKWLSYTSLMSIWVGFDEVVDEE